MHGCMHRYIEGDQSYTELHGEVHGCLEGYMEGRTKVNRGWLHLEATDLVDDNREFEV